MFSHKIDMTGSPKNTDFKFLRTFEIKINKDTLTASDMIAYFKSQILNPDIMEIYPEEFLQYILQLLNLPSYTIMNSLKDNKSNLLLN